VIEGRIASLPEQRPSPGVKEESPEEETAGAPPTGPKHDARFLFRPQDPALPRLIRVSWYRADQALTGGDCWRLKLRLRAPHGLLNPGGYDYEAWLFEQGIGATATVREASPCEDHSGYWLLRARQHVANRLAQWLPGHPALGLVAGLAVGDRALLQEQDWDTFRVSGTSHLMAIAGLHIGMVVAAVFFLLRWLWAAVPALCLRLPAQKAAMLGAVLAACVYALLSGFEPPAQRALLMLLFGFAAMWLDRPALLPRALALSWLLIVAANPLALLSPGLWLSFTAVAAIFYVISGRLGPRRRWQDRWQELLLLQLALSLALLPLSFSFFQGGGWIGPLANLVVVPLFTLMLPALLLALLLAWAAPALGVPAVTRVAAALWRVRQGLGWAATHLPDAWVAASPPPGLLLLAMLGMVLLLAPRGLPLRGFAALCFLPLFLPLDRAPKEGFRLTALDVGQGLSVVVRTARHTLLFDAGPAFEDFSDTGRSVVVPYLLSEGVHELDLGRRGLRNPKPAAGGGAARRAGGCRTGGAAGPFTQQRRLRAAHRRRRSRRPAARRPPRQDLVDPALRRRRQPAAGDLPRRLAQPLPLSACPGGAALRGGRGAAAHDRQRRHRVGRCHGSWDRPGQRFPRRPPAPVARAGRAGAARPGVKPGIGNRESGIVESREVWLLRLPIPHSRFPVSHSLVGFGTSP
jgi:competence protein ComEC